MATNPYSIPQEIAETLVDPSCHASDKLHDALKWLRANCPLGYAEPENTDPFWMVTRQSDIKVIAKQNDLFHSGERNITLIDRKQDHEADE